MSTELPVLKAKEVLRMLQRGGFYIHHQSGSHIQLKHQTKKGLRVTIPYHKKIYQNQ
jgi:predicted RNA binding protein YcfA (HicA-like mRNA interferase family)